MYLCSVELRELEAKLKAGYMNQERAAQLAEKAAMELDRQVRNLYLWFCSPSKSCFELIHCKCKILHN